MKKINIIIAICLYIICFNSNTHAATYYTWTGNTSTAWNVNGNWNPSSGFPGASDTATIVTTTNQPILDANRTVARLRMISGTLGLNGFTLTISYSSLFTAGTISNGTIRPEGIKATFTATHFNATVTSVSAQIFINGGVYDQPVALQDTGIAQTSSNGGAVFNSTVSFTKTGSNTGAWGLADDAGNTYNSTATFINTSDSDLYVVREDTSFFNGDIYVGCNNIGGVSIGGAASPGFVSVLASGKSIHVDGTYGFTNGTLSLKKMVQQGSTSQTFTLTSSALVNIVSCTFNAAVDVTSPKITIRDNIFNGTLSLTQSSSATTNSYGGNTFNAAVTLIGPSSGSLYFKMGVNADDTFNSDVTISGKTDLVTDNICTVKGNLYVGSGVNLNHNTSVIGTLRFAGSNAQVIHGNSVEVDLRKVKIEKDANNVTLDTTVTIADTLKLVSKNIISSSTHLLSFKTVSTVTGASNSSFVDGPVKKTGNTAFIFPTGKGSDYRALEMSAPSSSTNAYTAEYFNSAQSHGSSMDAALKLIHDCNYWSFTRNSGSANVTVKLNWDSTACGIYDSASIRVANWNGSTWKDLANGGITGNKYVGRVANSTTVITYGDFALAYNQCQILTNAGTDQSTCLGDSATIGASPVATRGTSSFTYSWSPSSGLSSTSVANPKASPTTTTNYVVMVTDARSCTKTDTVKVTSHPINYTWTGTTSTAWNTASNWSPAAVPGSCDNVTIVTGSNNVAISGSVTVKQFTINSGSIGGGTININGKAFFNGGTITTGWVNVNNSDTCALNGTHIICDADLYAAKLFFNGSIMDGHLEMGQSGSTDTYSAGGNTFNGDILLSIYGSNMYLANSAPDYFNNSVSLIPTSSGTVYFGYTKNVYFSSTPIWVYSGGIVHFGGNGGTAVFNGTSDQYISNPFSTSVGVTFSKLQVNKSSGDLICEQPITIYDSLFLTKGKIITDATNLLSFDAGSAVLGASDSSFVNGPVEKIGNTSFVFPIGKNNSYRAIKISAPSNSTDAFIAEFFDEVNANPQVLDVTLDYLYYNGYWNLVNSSISNVEITLYWNYNSVIQYPSYGRVSAWNGSSWDDLGNSAYTVSGYNGSLTSSISSGISGNYLFGLAPLSPIACSGIHPIGIPDAWYTFDVATGTPPPPLVNRASQTGNYLLENTNATSLFTISPSDPVPTTTGTINSTSLLLLPSTTEIRGPQLTLGPLTDSYFAIEMIFKLGHDFGKQRQCNFFTIDGGHFAYISSDEIGFITNDAGTRDALIVPLTGIDRKSIYYYLGNPVNNGITYNTDGWHHIAFIYKPGTPASKEIWIDGYLYPDFQDLSSDDLLINMPNQLRLRSSASYDNFVGMLDEIAIYHTEELCEDEIAEHFQNMVDGNYFDFATTLTYTPPTNLIDGDFDSNDYPDGFYTATPFIFTGVDESTDQILKCPLPRYFPLHTLRKNYNNMQNHYLAGFGHLASLPYEISRSIELQDELAKHWHYYYNVIENTRDLNDLSNSNSPTQFNNAWLGHALTLNENFEYAVSTLHGAVIPENANSSWAPGAYINSNDLSYFLAPYGTDNFLSNAANLGDTPTEYYDNICPSGTNINYPPDPPLYWSPAGDQEAYSNDGLTQQYYLDRLFNNYGFGKTLSFIMEDNEILGPFQYPSGIPCGPDLAPICTTAKNNSGLSWPDYIASRKLLLDKNSYKDKFLNSSVPYADRITNTMFLNYQVDGHPNEDFRFRYKYMRESQSIYSSDVLGDHYLSTPDYYIFNNPKAWKSESVPVGSNVAQHGWTWIDVIRKEELAAPFYDNRFAPFVAAGWSIDCREHIRPGQWLGLMKCLSLYGVDLFLPSHFVDASNIDIDNPNGPDSKGWAWQAVTPIYAHAISSRIESFLKNGHLMQGDIPIYLNDPNYGNSYRFNTGCINDLVIVRQLDDDGIGINKYAVSGAIEPISNTQFNGNLNRDVTIQLNGQDLKLNISRQGNTYIFDNTDPYSTGEQVFYQLDKWHQYEYPDKWTKDFHFEAEVFDNSPNALIKTRDLSNNPITDGDFSGFVSYISYNNGNTPDALEYRFTPRNDAYNNDYEFYIRAKVRTSGSTGIKVNIASVDGTESFSARLSGITNTSWTWYHLTCNGSAFNFGTLSNDVEFIMSILPENDLCEIDQIYLDSPDPLYYPVNPTPGTDINSTFTVTISNTSSPCSGLLGSGSLTANIADCGNSASYTYLWSTGETTATITGLSPFALYTVTVSDGSNSVIAIGGLPSSTTYDFVNPVIYGDVIWDNSINSTTTIKVEGIITIKDGATLTVDDGMTIQFSYGHSPDEICDQGMFKAGTVVEVGGKLDIQDNVILTGCNDGIWEGIEVVGDYSASQSPTTNQGYVEINGTSGNEAEIRNANLGILGVKAPGLVCDPKSGGGIIHADYCIFKDNFTAVKLINYPSSDSYFDHCKFQFTDDYAFSGYATSSGPIMISLFSHQGLKIANSEFECQNTLVTDDQKGIGVNAYNSEFRLQDLSGSGSGVNTITNLTQGVTVYQYTGSALHNEIEGNTFDNVMQGIYLQGIGTDFIYNNDFINMPLPYSSAVQSYGLQVIDGVGFTVQENNFTPSSSTSADQYAMRFQDCDGVVFKNHIFENSGEKFYIGIQTDDDNKHLKIGCNDFDEPGTYSLAVNSGRLRQQGLCGTNGEPAGNLWTYNTSPGCSGAENIYVDASVPTITYFKYATDISSNPDTPDPTCSSSGKVNLPACAINQTSGSCNFIFPAVNLAVPPTTDYEDYKEALKEAIAGYQAAADTNSTDSLFLVSEKWLLELELIKWQRIYEGMDSVIYSLYYSSSFSSKKQLAELYYHLNLQDSLTSILEEIDADTDPSREDDNNNFITAMIALQNATDENGLLNGDELPESELYETVAATTRSSEKSEILLNIAGVENYRHIIPSIAPSRLAHFDEAQLLQQNQEEFIFTLFPNPANNTVALSIKREIECENMFFMIYDKLGKMINRFKLLETKDPFQFSTKSLSEGLYSCKLVTCDGKEYIRKLAIIR